MDWTTIIVSLGTALLASGGIGGLFQIKEAKRAKKIENDKSAANEWKELYERSEKKADTLGEKLDRVYGDLRRVQEEKNDWKVQFAQAQFMLCRKTPCIERDPPLGSTSCTRKTNKTPTP
jgi:hypothetical protein